MKKIVTVLFAATTALTFGAMLGAAPAAPGSSLAVEMPPCEAKVPIKTPPADSSAPAAPKNLRIIGGADVEMSFDEELPSGPSAWPEAESGTAFSTSFAGPHDYYFALASRADCMRAFSLRSQAQIEEYRRTGTRPSAVTYDPANDPDPRKQDAAKIVIEGNSLATQVWLPISVMTGGKLMVTWDAWFGREFAYENTGITNYKNFQFTSPTDEIWSEVRSNWNKGRNGSLAEIDGRIYFSTPYPQSTHMGPNITGVQPLSPQIGTFAIQPETWTRYWAVFETDAQGWDTYSLWVADENNEPVMLFNKLQLKFRGGKLGVFRLEYNTSTSGVPEGRGPLVGYARNIVMLQNPGDVSSLMQKPVR